MPGRVPCHRAPTTGAKRHEQQRVDANRGTSAERGYGYRWRKARTAFLAAHPLCAKCAERGIVKAATDVDHIKPWRERPDLFWNTDNWQALCHECHAAKTAREDGGFGHGRENPRGQGQRD